MYWGLFSALLNRNLFCNLFCHHFTRFFLPQLVPHEGANVATKIAQRSFWRTQGTLFQSCNHAKIIHWLLVIWWLFFCHLLMVNQLFGLRKFKVALGDHIYEFVRDLTWGTHLQFWGLQKWVDIEIYQTPMLQKGMQSHQTASISWESLSTLWGRKVTFWFLLVHLNNLVAKCEIGLWIFVGIFSAEKLRQRLHFQLVNLVKIEPLSWRWQN